MGMKYKGTEKIRTEKKFQFFGRVHTEIHCLSVSINFVFIFEGISDVYFTIFLFFFSLRQYASGILIYRE